jgi:predicted transcriptional regulator
MSRTPNIESINEVYELIKCECGISISEIARRTGVDYSGAIRRLATMESLGILTFEDNAGLIYAYKEYSPHTWG